MFYDLMQDEELKGIKDFDSKLRKAQMELDTLVLSHDHRFAIEQCRFPHSFHQIHNNPYLQIDEQVYDAIAIVQKEALLQKGMPEMLYHMPIDYRLEILGIDNPSSSENNTPSP